MWKQWKKAAVVLMACTMLLNMTGCKKQEEKLKEPQTEQKTRQKDEKEAESKEETIPANQNLLTGLADLSETAIGKRPVAVMVNNHEAARPQYGIAQADILYEIPVEGDITRLMALYADYTKVPQICPIRSCRYYFPALSQGYDAFYVNWGIDDGIADYLEALQLDQYDGIYNAGGLFGRDENRLAAGYSLEHTGYTDNSDDTPYFWEGDALLLATGRRPMTDGLNLHAAGIRTDTRGAVIVNEHLQTTSPHIWAMGDVRGGALYDYLSLDDFRIITNRLFGNKKRKTDDRIPVPYVIFTDPPLAHIGMTEEEAVKRGYSLQVSRLPAAAIPRARTLQQIDGMMKAIVNAHTGRIIGCTLFCIDAPEVINLVSLAMKNDLHYSILRDFIFTHPSMSEGLNDLFKAF